MAAPVVMVDLDITVGIGQYPAQGFAYLAPSVQVTDATDAIVIPVVPQATAFNGTLRSLSCYATDNANMTPAGWTWVLNFSQLGSVPASLPSFYAPPVPGNPAPIAFYAPAGPCNFTLTHAAPAVFTWTPTPAFTQAFNGIMPNGTALVLTTLSGGGGFSTATTYYVVNSNGSTFQLAASRGGSSIASSATGSGTLTVTRYTYSGLSQAKSVPTNTPFATQVALTAETARAEAAESNATFVYNVKTYGAIGNAIADDTAAFQAAINAATGSANPATTTRTPVAPVYIPPGNYKITSDLIIRSVSGFRLTGAGIAQVTLFASGTGFTQAVLLIDGSLDGIFEGFAIQGTGTEQVPNGIRLDKTSAASRSTTANHFRDIRVRNLKAVDLFSLEGNGSVQLDGSVLTNIVLTGTQTPGSWSSSGNWQTGFKFGNGVYANNYDHVLTGCSVALCYYGMKVNASSIDLDGSQPAANYSDFWVLTNGQTSIKNVQSQGSGQFLTTPSSFPPEANTISDVLFVTFNPNAGYPVLQLNGGMWVVSNFSVGFIYASSAYQTGIFSVTGQSAARPCIAIFDNLTVTGAKTSAFSLSHADVSVRNYHNYNPATGNYTTPVAGDLLSTYTGGSWNNIDSFVSATAPSVSWVTTPGTTTYNIPAGATTVDVVLQGGGGGGGSGALTASGQSGGGAGGNAGGFSRGTYVAADLGSSVSLTVGAGGAGGAAIATTPASGNVGIAGLQSVFGTVLHAGGGGPGSFGTSAAGGAISGTPGIGFTQWGSNAGAGSATTTGNAGAAYTVAQNGASGGGGGAGTTGSAAANGGATQIPGIGAAGNTGSGGVAGGAAATAGTQPTVKGIPSCGGGGGASAFGTASTAQAGADAFNGGGGGGGGGCSGGGASTSGKGGNGGDGFALIIAHFT